jgi:hypothetical protein
MQGTAKMASYSLATTAFLLSASPASIHFGLTTSVKSMQGLDTHVTASSGMLIQALLLRMYVELTRRFLAEGRKQTVGHCVKAIHKAGVQDSSVSSWIRACAGVTYQRHLPRSRVAEGAWVHMVVLFESVKSAQSADGDRWSVPKVRRLSKFQIFCLTRTVGSRMIFRKQNRIES